MTYWLVKSEPQTYSIEDLARDRETIWDGVRNYQARNFLKQMQVGESVFFYHSNTKTPGIVGLAEVTQSNVIDPTQFDPNSPYYDPKATGNAPRWQTCAISFVEAFSKTIPLTTLKQQFSVEELLLVRRGNRLSVMPVSEAVAAKLLKMK
jgi:predicted RNA-binding protein with PUA-like domain